MAVGVIGCGAALRGSSGGSAEAWGRGSRRQDAEVSEVTANSPVTSVTSFTQGKPSMEAHFVAGLGS
jgi:hypothetical protein